jgi:hypothetical protein
VQRKLGNELRPAFLRACADPSAIRHTMFSVEVDHSFGCEAPVTTVTESAFVEKGVKKDPPRDARIERRVLHDPGYRIVRHVKCRKCPNCLRAHARHWAARAATEISVAPRTWFVTLTMTVENHLRFEYAISGVGHMTDAEKYKALVRAEYGEVKKAFKRLRARGVKARYLAVDEPHKSGWPHVHLLVHEVEPNTITKRLLAGDPDEGIESWFWPHGFVHARLVEEDKSAASAAWYVCTYLKKHASSRTRASQNYGGL